MFINKKAVYLLRINVKSGTMIDKYINPHTDFGFKRLFGSEFSEQDQKLYEDSMNAYRDIVNAIRTAEKKKYAEGEAEGLAKGLKLKETTEEDGSSVQPLMPSGKRIRAIPESWTSSFGKQFYAQEKSVIELQRQSEADWMLRLEGQLFETGNKLHVTGFEELRSFITQELQGVEI